MRNQSKFNFKIIKLKIKFRRNSLQDILIMTKKKSLNNRARLCKVPKRQMLLMFPKNLLILQSQLSNLLNNNKTLTNKVSQIRKVLKILKKYLKMINKSKKMLYNPRTNNSLYPQKQMKGSSIWSKTINLRQLTVKKRMTIPFQISKQSWPFKNIINCTKNISKESPRFKRLKNLFRGLKFIKTSLFTSKTIKIIRFMKMSLIKAKKWLKSKF